MPASVENPGDETSRPSVSKPKPSPHQIAVVLAFAAVAAIFILLTVRYAPELRAMIAPVGSEAHGTGAISIPFPVFAFFTGALAASLVAGGLVVRRRRRQSDVAIEPLIACLRAIRTESALLLVDDMVPEPKRVPTAMRPLVDEMHLAFEHAASQKLSADLEGEVLGADDAGPSLDEKTADALETIVNRINQLSDDIANLRSEPDDTVTSALKTLAASLQRVETVMENDVTGAIGQMAEEASNHRQDLRGLADGFAAFAHNTDKNAEDVLKTLREQSAGQTALVDAISPALDALKSEIKQPLERVEADIATLAEALPSLAQTQDADLTARLKAIEAVVADELEALSRTMADRDASYTDRLDGIATRLSSLSDAAESLQITTSAVTERFDASSKVQVSSHDELRALLDSGLDHVRGEIANLKENDGVKQQLDDLVTDNRRLATGIVEAVTALSGQVAKLDTSSAAQPLGSEKESGIEALTLLIEAGLKRLDHGVHQVQFKLDDIADRSHGRHGDMDALLKEMEQEMKALRGIVRSLAESDPDNRREIAEVRLPKLIAGIGSLSAKMAEQAVSAEEKNVA
ncbi:MAG: hypothetical protein AAGA88_06400 [Pseudomonadota bacterium]